MSLARLLPTRPGIVATAALLAAAAFPGVASAPASASTGLGVACPDPTSQPFLPWGDAAFYKAVPNGGFENGAAGWKLTGNAGVVPGNESFDVSGESSSSLSLRAGSTATTAPMCVSLLSSKMRFFVANSGARDSRLKVQVVYGGGTGALLGAVGSTLGVSDVGYMTASDQWQPSSELTMLGGALPLLTGYVQFRFTPVGAAGAWSIDDIYLDPLKHR